MAECMWYLRGGPVKVSWLWRKPEPASSSQMLLTEVPEATWMVATGCSDLRENTFPSSLPFTHYAWVHQDLPFWLLRLSFQTKRAVRRLSTPPVGVKGRFRPFHLAVEAGLVLSPISKSLQLRSAETWSQISLFLIEESVSWTRSPWQVTSLQPRRSLAIN